MKLNLNSRARVQLTSYGLFRVLSVRDEIAGVEKIIASGGVWETELWRIMNVLAPTFEMGAREMAVMDNSIELIIDNPPLPPPPGAREEP